MFRSLPPRHYNRDDKAIPPSNNKYPRVSPDKIHRPYATGDRGVYSYDRSFEVWAECPSALVEDVFRKTYLSISYSRLSEFKLLLRKRDMKARWIASNKMWAFDYITRWDLRALYHADFNDLYDQNENAIPLDTIRLYMRPIFRYVPNPRYDPNKPSFFITGMTVPVAPLPPKIDTPYLLPVDSYIVLHSALHKKGMKVTKEIIDDLRAYVDEKRQKKEPAEEQQKKEPAEEQQKKIYPIGWQVVKMPEEIEMLLCEYMETEFFGTFTFTPRVNMKKCGRLDGFEILIDASKKTDKVPTRMCPIHKCYYYTHNGKNCEAYIQGNHKMLLKILSDMYDELKRTMRND